MITGTPQPRHLAPPAWQLALRQCVTDPDELLGLVGLGPQWVQPARAAAARFALRVPRGYVTRMRPGDPDDPLLRQVLPLREELEERAGYVADPVGDLAALAATGVLHKYAGRALLVTTGHCAIHCRYCFRREFPYEQQHAGRGGYADALGAIRADPTLAEVILSGGDPLTLGDRRLASLLAELAAIPHVRRVRIHSRLPIVLPERIDAGFLGAWNVAAGLQRVVVVHANHARELRGVPEVAAALAALRDAGTVLLNQSVLLRGVNDEASTLADLSEALFAAGVLPYYLHLLDPVRGAAYLDVPEAEARRLVAEVGDRLPGYLVPRLVREIPGAASKTIVPPASR
jgi:EF-P beta-lysylation protein EpmB